jgi:DNA-3-methyladenine glycosylase
MTSSQKKLPQNFYYQNVHDVAKKLLGKYFVREFNGKNLIGKIVEVEAYDGKIDQAAHSFNGKTKRNEVMFNGGGNLYVYFTYGMHFCSNVVTGKPGDGTAILLRALEPVEGIDEMALNRFGKKDISEKEKINLTNGPAKICIALNIKREDNGTPLNGGNIFILDEKNIRPEQIFTTTRIGIKKSVDLPWRYYIKDNRYVSKK